MLLIKCSALQGLKMFPALIIVPALQICWTLFSILSGMLYFHEYEGMRAGPTAMFVIGVAVSPGMTGQPLYEHCAEGGGTHAHHSHHLARLLAARVSQGSVPALLYSPPRWGPGVTRTARPMS